MSDRADDRGEIENLLARYCELFDSGDMDGYVALFSDAHIANHFSASDGPEELRAFFERNGLFYEDGKPHTRHVTTNVHIEVAPDGMTAEARSYVTVFQALSDFPLQPVFIGQYQDELVKKDGTWRFASRVCEPFFLGRRPQPPRPGVPAAGTGGGMTADGLIDAAQSGQGFWELLTARTAATPDALLVIDERGRQLTYAEYKDRAEAVAAGLADRGVGEGSVVVWQLPTWIETFVLMGALARLGATQVPLIPSYRAREVSFIIRQTGAELFVVPSPWKKFDYPDMARTIAGEVDGLDVLVLDTEDRELPSGDPGRLAPLAPSPAEAEDFAVRWIYFTSGTTGSPKGTRHTDATLFGAVAGMIAMLEPGPGDRSSLVFPFAHIGGVVWLLTSFVCGSAHLVVESFSPATTIPMLAANGVTLAGTGTPFNLAYLEAQRELTASSPGARLFPHVRGFMSGAAPKPPTLHADLRDELGGTGILSSYGMTEAPIVTACGPWASEAHRASTEGKASPGVDLKVLDPDGQPVKAGESGEIRLKGPQLCRGYLDASLNAEAFDENGYIRTGDLGVLDEEGFLTIVGRLKDVIIRNGENISAKEIEDLLFAHPAVRDVAVIGLPDARVGERCCAVIALDDSKGPFGFDEMVTFLRGHDLMVQKLPEQMEILESIPRNAAGKVLKEQLRTQFAESSPR